MKITTIGIELAKIIFQAHGVNQHGKGATRKKLKRAKWLHTPPTCLHRKMKQIPEILEDGENDLSCTSLFFTVLQAA